MLDEEQVREHRDWLLRQAECARYNNLLTIAECYERRAQEWTEVLEGNDGKELLHGAE